MATEKLFSLSSSVQALPRDVTTARDSYAWDCKKLASVLTPSEG